MIASLLMLFALALAVPAGAAQFEDINPGAGIPVGHSVAWGDYSGDGYPDLFVTGRPDWPVVLGVYQNDADLSFSNVSAEVGIPPSSHANAGAVWGDYNNDGNLDAFVGGDDGQQDLLFRFDGALLTDVATSAGLTQAGGARTASWCDYDGDSLLDLFVCYVGPDNTAHLYRNNGDGTFGEAAEAAGTTWPPAGDVGDGCAWGDYDNDGRPDLLVAAIHESHQALYHNDGGGEFTDVGATALANITNVRGVAWGDYDNDGWLDVYLGTNAARSGWLLHNNGDGAFSDVTFSAGLADRAAASQAVAWADYDNDGYLDLYVGGYYSPPSLYHSNGNGTFTEVAAANGLAGSYLNNSAAWADIDRDGRPDLVEVNGLETEAIAGTRLLHNVGPAGNWLRVRALTSGTGDATGSDPVRDAVGARADLNLDNDDAFPSGRTLARLIDGGSGCLSQDEQIAQFGLGSAALVAVRVRFPDGSIVVHRSVPANGQITIRDIPADREEIFDDVPLDFWAYEQIRGCVDNSIVAGYDDDLYHPDWPVTRDQMAVYISRALAGGDDNVPDFTDTPTFPDVPETNWALDYIEYAVEQGVVTGYDDGYYHPEYEVTRDQMAVYVARALVAPTGEAALADYVPSDPRNFPDVADTFWAYKHIEYCVENSVVQGYLDGLYHPEITVTRDQMAVYVARAFDLPM
jgi:hypothetical protein